MAVEIAAFPGLTNKQRRDFDEKGYVVIEDFFSKAELDRLMLAIDEVGLKIRRAKGLAANDPWALRNALDKHEAFLDLIDHPRALPLVVDTIGWNVQVRTTHLDVRPPYPKDLQPGELGSGKGADHLAGYRNVVWHPGSQHWIPKTWVDVPLKAWAEARETEQAAKVQGLHL